MPYSSCEHLTPAERDLLQLIVAGLRVTEAAARTGRTINTARTHVKHLHDKTGTHTIAALAAWAEEHRDCCVG